MQEPMLRDLGVDVNSFWEESDDLAKKQRELGVNVDGENGYLIRLLQCTHQPGVLQGFSNADLRWRGGSIIPFPGLPDFFFRMKNVVERNRTYQDLGIKVEHYIVSTGLKEMIAGSVLNAAGAIDGIYASEFMEESGRITYIARAVGHQKKTEFLHMINKGANVDQNIDVNDDLPDNEKRIPWHNMIYLGDSGVRKSDHACFATLRHRHAEGNNWRGVSIVVYGPEKKEAREQAQAIYNAKKVDYIASADYSAGSELSRLVERRIRRMAERIRERATTAF